MIYFGFFMTIIAYIIGKYIQQKFKSSLTNPLLIAVILIIVILVVFSIDYHQYYQGASYISYFLTPATICLAIPLYKQIHLLKENKKAIGLGIVAGVMTHFIMIFFFAFLFQLTKKEIITFLPKSITTAIGIPIVEQLGGYVSISVAAIIITGILGNIVAYRLLSIANIKHPVARGIAIGCSSHAIGTTKAMEMGEIEGAMSSLSLVLSGLLTVIIISYLSLLM